MFFIFGWLRRFTILGLKVDECSNCAQVSQHVVGQKTSGPTSSEFRSCSSGSPTA